MCIVKKEGLHRAWNERCGAVWEWECQRQEKRPLRWRCCRVGVGREAERERKKRERQLENICCNTNLPQTPHSRPTRHTRTRCVSDGAATDAVKKSAGENVFGEISQHFVCTSLPIEKEEGQKRPPFRSRLASSSLPPYLI